MHENAQRGVQVEIPTTVAREVAAFCFAGAWIAPVPLFVVDHQAVVFANAAALRLLDYEDASALFGQPLDRILHADALVAEFARREVLATIRQPLLGVPTKLRSGRDEPRQALADVAPLEVDGRQLTLFTFDPALSPETRSKPGPAPEAKQLDHELGWAILESMNTPILIHDLDTILFVNAAARPFFRATDRMQVEGRPITAVVHPDGVLATLERVVFFFATRQRLRGVPVKMKAVDGTAFHVEGDAYPILAGNRWGALVVGRFIRVAE
jgi:PAS domain-containing protein